MRKNGYVRDLKKAAEGLGAPVTDYRLFDYCGNPLNPSGLVLIDKAGMTSSERPDIQWRCPLTHSALVADAMGFYSNDTGIVYPVLAGVPLLRSSRAVVASSFENIVSKKMNIK